MPVIKCVNAYCPYCQPESPVHLVCTCPHVVSISRTGECNTFWFLVAQGKARDLREIPFSEDPQLDRLFKREGEKY